MQRTGYSPSTSVAHSHEAFILPKPGAAAEEAGAADTALGMSSYGQAAWEFAARTAQAEAADWKRRANANAARADRSKLFNMLLDVE